MIKFFVPGKPLPQPRPRVYTHAGQVRAVSNKGPVAQWKKVVATMAQLTASQEEWEVNSDDPLHLGLIFLIPRTKRAPKKRPHREYMTVRPDVDNLVKAVKDCCTGILWHDDCQITHVDASKFRAAANEEPGVLVNVSVLPPLLPVEVDLVNLEDLPF